MAWGSYEDKIDEDFSEWHFIPHFGRGPHIAYGMGCWCKPVRDKYTPVFIMHNVEN